MDKIVEKKRWTTKKIAAIIASAVLIIFIAITFVLADGKSSLNVEKSKITISEVIYEPFQEYIPVTGTVEPIETFYLDLSDGGKVVTKYVQEGAVLKAGDPIIKLDNPNLSLQVMSTQSGFLQAENMARQTRLTFEQNLLNKQDQLLNLNMNLLKEERIYKNNKVLYEKSMISKNEFENSRESYETLLKSRSLLLEVLRRDSLTYKQLMQQGESNVEMSKNYLSLVESQLKNLTVKAPINGQLTALNAEIGQSINAGFRIGQIDNVDSFKVKAEIDEHYVSRVTEGLTADYEFEGRKYELKIKTVYPQITNGKFYADMLFTSGRPKDIRRGQSVYIKLRIGSLSKALLVENGGFYSTTGGQWIFTVDKSETAARRRQIKIGRQNPEYFEVLEGLKPGDKIISSSYENFAKFDKLVLK